MKRTRAAAVLVFAVVVASCAGPALERADAGAAGGQAAPIELQLQPYGPLKTVSLTVGSITGPFILDTGGGLNVLTPKVAAEVGCHPFGRVVGFRASGESIAAERCQPFGAPAAAWPDTADWTVFDIMALLGDAPEVAGLVGLPLFEGRTVTLDLVGNRLIVETAASAAQRIAGAKELHVRPARQAGGASLDLFVSLETPEGPIWLEMDSGNAGPVLISPHAARQLGVTFTPGEARDITLDVTGLGPVSAKAVERETIYDGLLSAGWMEQMVVTFDLASMRAWARLRTE